MSRSFALLAVIAAILCIPAVASADPPVAGAPITNGDVMSGTALSPNFLTVRPVPNAKKDPTGKSLCYSCGGGGSSGGCAQATDRQDDWTGSFTTANMYFCFNGRGNVTYLNTWSGQEACGGVCTFVGYNYDYQFNDGRNTQAEFRYVDVWFVHYDTYDHACVAGNGWGGAWACA